MINYSRIDGDYSIKFVTEEDGMALSPPAFLRPRLRAREIALKNPSWVAVIRGWATTEEQEKEILANTSAVLQNLCSAGFPILRVIFLVWKGHPKSPIPGDRGRLASLVRTEAKRLQLPFEVEVGEVETLDPYGTLLNLGLGLATSRGGDYMLSVSPAAADYLEEEVARSFIDALVGGALGVGLEMSEVKSVIGPSNRLALWPCGATAAVGGFATSATCTTWGSDGTLRSGTAMCQEQTPTLVNMDIHFGPCVRMVKPTKQGLYRLPVADLTQRLHAIVAENTRVHQAAWLSVTGSSADKLLEAISY
jgi:hypothetical protein